MDMCSAEKEQLKQRKSVAYVIVFFSTFAILYKAYGQKNSYETPL